MPTRWTTSTGRLLTVAKRAGARYGLKAAIVVSGAAVAISTVNRTTYVQETPLAQRVVALAPAPRVVAESVTVADTAAVASSSLDNGADHGLIDKWIGRLSV